MELKKQILLYLVIFYLIGSPIISFAQERESGTKIPQSWEEVKLFLVKLFGGIPEGIKKAWQEAISFWQRMYQKVIEIWKRYCWDRVEKTLIFLKTQFERRRLIFKEEFKKKLQETKEDLSKFWKKISEILFKKILERFNKKE